MDLLTKIDIMLQDESGATLTGNVAKNVSKGNVDIVGGECPKGQRYDPKKKVCVPIKRSDESVLAGIGDIAGSQQTRTWGRIYGEVVGLRTKNDVEVEFDDPTQTNIMGRKPTKFNYLTGVYTPEPKKSKEEVGSYTNEELVISDKSGELGKRKLKFTKRNIEKLAYEWDAKVQNIDTTINHATMKDNLGRLIFVDIKTGRRKRK